MVSYSGDEKPISAKEFARLMGYRTPEQRLSNNRDITTGVQQEYRTKAGARGSSPVAETGAKIGQRNKILDVSSEEIYRNIEKIDQRAKTIKLYRDRNYETHLGPIDTGLQQAGQNDAYVAFVIPMRTAAKMIAGQLRQPVSSEEFFDLHRTEITGIIQNARDLKKFLKTLKI